MRYIKDLLLTDAFFIKGHVATGGTRLTSFLNNTPRRFIEVHEAVLRNRFREESVAAPLLQIRLEEIVLAHEMDENGDEALKTLAERNRDEVMVRFWFGGGARLELSGMMSRRAFERDAAGAGDFIVIRSPVVRGRPDDTELLDPWTGIPYLAANRSRAAFIFI